METTSLQNMAQDSLIAPSKSVPVSQGQHDFNIEISRERSAPEFVGILKQVPEDFRVYEQLKFEMDGEGQHLALLIEKKLLNSQDVVAILAHFFKVHPRDIGYFGMKDRVALTQQWFSVDMAQSDKTEADLSGFDAAFPALLHHVLNSQRKQKQPQDSQTIDSFQQRLEKQAYVKIIEIKRNSKKLQIGKLAGNRFEIVCRDIQRITHSSDADVSLEHALQSELESALENRLASIKQAGFPNYFGAQRFGYQGGNLQELHKHAHSNLDKRRFLRSRVISSLRSLGFNQYLSRRIDMNSHRTCVSGDVLQFCDGNTLFAEAGERDNLQARIDRQEICITGPLLGYHQVDDKHSASGESLLLEERVQSSLQVYSALLERYKVKPARRALIAQVNNMSWYFSANDLFLQFELLPGCFATSLIRELVE